LDSAESLEQGIAASVEEQDYVEISLRIEFIISRPFTLRMNFDALRTFRIGITAIIAINILRKNEFYRKKLTTYKAITIRKSVPLDMKTYPSTWAQAQFTEESWPQEEISKQIQRLNEERTSVMEKKQNLARIQQLQVNIVLDDQIKGEQDLDFEWSLIQLEDILILRNGMKETVMLRA